VITTTQDRLEQLITQGFFREDLFYRINEITLTVPPLRDRREQIIPLSQYFLNFYRTKYGKPIPSLSFATLSALKSYEWPGNIRELENVIKRIVLLGEEERVMGELIERKSGSHANSAFKADISSHSPGGSNPLDLREAGRKAAESAEIEIIRRVLHETHWNRKVAAGLLRISYKALLNKIQRFSITRWTFRAMGEEHDGDRTGENKIRMESGCGANLE
jgi:transcriptional regulator with PAS, ATPase and Fis domain